MFVKYSVQIGGVEIFSSNDNLVATRYSFLNTDSKVFKIYKSVRFYTKGSGEYKGWLRPTKKNLHAQFIGWVRSGNYLMVGNEKVTEVERIKEFLKGSC